MHQSGFRRDTVWLFVTSYFVVMDVSSHFFYFFHLNCQLLFREQKGWQVCAPDPDGHSTKREFVREPGLVLCSLWLIAIQNLSGSFILALLRSQFKYFQLYRVEKKGKKMPLLYSHFFWTTLVQQGNIPDHPTEFARLHPLCWSGPPSEDAESLPAHRAADSDLWLLQRRANEKDKFPTRSNPSSRKLIWLNCPFKFQSRYVSGSTSTQPGVSAQSAHLLLAASRTSLAPACFPSITIYQATIKAEGRALASLCVRKTKENNNNSAEKKLTQKTPELVVKADLLLKCQTVCGALFQLYTGTQTPLKLRVLPEPQVCLFWYLLLWSSVKMLCTVFTRTLTHL